MEERRKDRRYKGKLLIATVYRDDSGKIITDDSIYTYDISLGGLRLFCPRPLPKGKILDLKLFLFSDPIHLPAQGRVVWSDKRQGLEIAKDNKSREGQEELYWAGVQFIDIDDFTRDRIINWIRQEFHEKAI